MNGRPRTRRFDLSDWAWVSTWARDEALDRALGPWDETWVQTVLTETDGVQLVVEDADGPVGLVGIVWDPDGDRHVVTDLAVDPSRRRSGLGREVLSAALAWAGHRPARGWSAYVDPENAPARAFFSSSGWTHRGVEDGMHHYGRTA